MTSFIRKLFAPRTRTIRRTPPRFRPSLLAMEDRSIPTILALSAGGSLTLTGTPDATDTVIVRHIGQDQYQVLDGEADLGPFTVTRNLRVQLDAAADGQVIRIDLAGDQLNGNVLARVGSGDAAVEVTNTAATAAKVTGDVTFTAGDGRQRFLLTPIYAPETEEPTSYGPLEVRDDVRVENGVAADAERDRFELGPQTAVGDDVTAHGIDTTFIQGPVGGDVTSNAPDTPGGAWFFLEGATVGGDVRVTGGVGPDGEGYNWYYLGGSVGGDCFFRAAGGSTDMTVFASVGGNLVYTGTSTAEYISMFSGTQIGGSAILDFGGGVDEFSGTQIHEVDIGGSLVVTGRGGGLTDVWLGVRYYSDPETGEPLPQLPSIGGGLLIALTGAGAENYATIDLTPGSAPLGVVYVGGAGMDWLEIKGQNSYRTAILTGGGDDTVLFDPDGTVGAALIDFGSLPGTKVFIPPTEISFPLVLRNYP